MKLFEPVFNCRCTVAELIDFIKDHTQIVVLGINLVSFQRNFVKPDTLKGCGSCADGTYKKLYLSIKQKKPAVIQ